MVNERQYGCASHRNGGAQLCNSKRRVKRAVVEQRLLAGIKEDLITPEAIDLFKNGTSRLLAERKNQQRPELQHKQQRLAEVDKEIDSIMAAIKAGVFTKDYDGRIGESRGRTRQSAKATQYRQ